MIKLCFLSRRFGSKTDAQSGGGRKGLHPKNQRTLRNGTNRPKHPQRKPRRVKARWTRTADNKSDKTRPHVCAHRVESDVDSTTCCGVMELVAMLHSCTYLHFIIDSLSIYIYLIFFGSILCTPGDVTPSGLTGISEYIVMLYVTFL